MDTTERLTVKLHRLWQDLEADERRLFAAALSQPEAEVSGYIGRENSIECIAVSHSVQAWNNDWLGTAVTSPRDPSTGMATGVVSPRDHASGLPTG